MRKLLYEERWDLQLISDRLGDLKFESELLNIPMTVIEARTLKAVIKDLIKEYEK